MAEKLNEICDMVGLTGEPKAYFMEGRGFLHTMQVVNVGETVEDFLKEVVEPLVEGKEIKGKTWKLATMEEDDTS